MALDDLQPHLAAIALEGAKGVGKTATARERARTVVDLTDPAQRQVIEADESQIERRTAPVLIDEWQRVPSIWDAVRRAVDHDPSGGRFILTGSAEASAGLPIHSGAGRIVRLQMRPMSWAERGINEASVSMAEVLREPLRRINGETTVDLAQYVAEILRSGFPGIRDLPDRARRAQLDGYLARVVDHDLRENAMTVRQPSAMRAWLAAYAAATATDASYSAILDAATPGESEKPDRHTVATYREHLQRLFLLDPLPAWIPSFAPLKRLTRQPRHHLVDPALSARLVGTDVDSLLAGKGAGIVTRPDTGTWLGALFESLVVQAVRVYAEAAEATVGHLRTKAGEHEVDIIVENADRTLVAIEVKLSATVDEGDVKHLHWLKAQLGDRVVDRLVINTGRDAYRRRDGIGVVPLALLGP